MTYVPFNRPYVTGDEFGYIREAIANGHLSGNGPFAERCSEWLERSTGSDRALLTHTCTAALEMTALLAELAPGDEVIMPSFTFVSTANAFALRGAVPVFCEIRSDTLNLDERAIESAITERTRAIVVVHYAGVACEMDTIKEIAGRRGLTVIEDAAHALLSTYRGRQLGSIGELGTLSFHETKNVSCGEGGALLVNDRRLLERAEVIHEKGTNRRRFMRAEVDKYSWVDLGSSCPPSEVNAAFLYAQLEQAAQLTGDRLGTWSRYHQALEKLEVQGKLRRPIVPEHCRHNGHMYYMLVSGDHRRDDVIEDLERQDVNAVFHYVPLHSSPAGLRLGRPAGELPLTQDASDRLIRLPMWVGMGEAEAEQVVRAVDAALNRAPATVR